MSQVWNITYGATTHTAQVWGLTAHPLLKLVSHAPSSMTWTMVGADPTTSPPFPFRAEVKIERVTNGTTDFTFIGRCRPFTGNADALQPGIIVHFEDAFRDLDETVYQQDWNFYSGSPPTATPVPLSFAMLFINPATGATETVAQVIARIITMAATAGVNLQCGTIDFGFPQYAYPVEGATCGQLLRKCLDLIQDCATWIDYTTTPPTLHARTRANRTAVTLPFASTDGSGRVHKSSHITPRSDLVPSQVVLQYRQPNTMNGQTYSAFAVDAYPPGSSGLAIGALAIPIDLLGFGLSNTSLTHTSQTFSPASTAWWAKKKPELADTHIASLAIADTTINGGSSHPLGVTVTDTSGNPISITGLYEWVKGPCAAWALVGGNPIQITEALVTARFTYHENNGPGGTTTKSYTTGSEKTHHTRVKLTNSPAGDQVYSSPLGGALGEAQIANLAQSYFNTLATLDYDGEHIILERDKVATIISPANVLNLSGGATAWATMRASIPSVEIDFYECKTTVRMGPAHHIAIQDLARYLQFYRNRKLIESSTSPYSGQPGGSGGGTLNIGNDNPKQDSTEGLGTPSVAVHNAPPDGPGNVQQILFNPAGASGALPLVTIQKVNSSGANVSSAPSVVLDHNDIQPGTNGIPSGTVLVFRYRVVDICVDVNGTSTPMKIAGIFSQTWTP